MDIRQLRIFAIAAETLNFRRAAEKLGIAQPAVSQRIQQFESELGFALFHRVNRGVELTSAGQVMLDEITEVLERVDRLEIVARMTERGETGKLRIGFATSIMSEPDLPSLIRRYIEIYPDININLQSQSVAELVRSAETFDSDVVFVRAPSGTLSAKLMETPFSEARLMVSMRDGHALAGHRRLAIEALADQPLILMNDPNGIGLDNSVLSLFHGANVVPKIRMRCTDMTALVGLVASGAGIAILPHGLAKAAPGTVAVPIEGEDAVSKVTMIHRRGHLSLQARAFVDMARDR